MAIPSSQPRAGFARRLLRAASRVAAVLLILALSGMTVQANAERSERAAFPPPGQLVDIGGGEFIHLRTWGAADGGPTLILDVSAGQALSLWAWIGPELGKHHRVVAYDRPGMGWSTGPDAPRDAVHAANALDRALDAAGIGPPYVVVGHSFGGFSARAFTGAHRDEVAGLVLLDTTHPAGGGSKGFAMFYRTRAWQGHAGLYELSTPPNDFWELPEEEQAPARAVSYWTTHLDTTAEELEAWETSAAQLHAMGDFGDLPLLVVCSYASEAHVALQRDLANLSSNSRFEQLNVNHMGMLVSRPQAELTVDAIRRFLAELGYE